jgi:hypothetical protein
MSIHAVAKIPGEVITIADAQKLGITVGQFFDLSQTLAIGPGDVTDDHNRRVQGPGLLISKASFDGYRRLVSENDAWNALCAEKAAALKAAESAK